MLFCVQWMKWSSWWCVTYCHEASRASNYYAYTYISMFFRRWLTPTNTICLMRAEPGRFWFAATQASDAPSVLEVSVTRWVILFYRILKLKYLLVFNFTLPLLSAWTKHPKVSKVLLPPTRRGSGGRLCPQETKSWWVWCDYNKIFLPDHPCFDELS